MNVPSVLYVAGATVIGGGAVVLELAQSVTPDVTVAQITAYGVIVLGVVAAIPIIIAAFGALRAQQAKAAADAAVVAAVLQKNLDKTEEVAVKVDGHWSDIERRLNASDEQNRELMEVVKKLTARVATADQDAAVAATEKAAAVEAGHVKELSNAKALADAKAAPAEER